MNPWNLNKRVERFWQAAFVQNLLTVLFWRYEKMVKVSLEGSERESVRSNFVNSFDQIVKKIGITHGVTYEGQFTFDETVWPPEEDCYMKRGHLFLKFSPVAEYFAFRLDFDKEIREGGVSIIANCDGYSTPQFIPTDVFHINFVDAEGQD